MRNAYPSKIERLNKTAADARRFNLVRDEDITGLSGTGIVGYGVMFPDGTVVLRWDSVISQTGVYAELADIYTIHGHAGRTHVDWIDEPQAR